jgi:heat shock protein HslJ
MSRPVGRLLVGVAIAALAVAIAALAVAGCDAFPAGPTRLDGTQWRVVEVGGTGPVAGSEPFVRFVGGQIQGSTGCNDFGGPFSLTIDDELSIGELTTTRAVCDGPLGAQEAAMLMALRGAERIDLQGDRLEIAGSGGRLAFLEGLG